MIACRLHSQFTVYLAALPNTAEEEGGDKPGATQQAVAEAAAVTGPLAFVRYIPEGAAAIIAYMLLSRCVCTANTRAHILEVVVQM